MEINEQRISLDAKRRRSAPTLPRIERLLAEVTIAEASLASGLSTFTISRIERYPKLARPGQIGRLLEAVAKISAAREAAADGGGPR